MSSLYELTEQFKIAVAHLDEMELEQDLYQDTYDAMQLPIEEKVENTIKYIKNLEALADARKAEAKRLSDLASEDLKKAEKLKNSMANHLKSAGITKLQAGVFSLGWRKGTEVVQVDETKTPSVDEAPHLYLYQEPKFISKTDLKKFIKAGQEIPGVTIVRTPDSLVVK